MEFWYDNRLNEISMHRKLENMYEWGNFVVCRSGSVGLIQTHEVVLSTLKLTFGELVSFFPGSVSISPVELPALPSACPSDSDRVCSGCTEALWFFSCFSPFLPSSSCVTPCPAVERRIFLPLYNNTWIFFLGLFALWNGVQNTCPVKVFCPKMRLIFVKVPRMKML